MSLQIPYTEDGPLYFHTLSGVPDQQLVSLLIDVAVELGDRTNTHPVEVLLRTIKNYEQMVDESARDN